MKKAKKYDSPDLSLMMMMTTTTSTTFSGICLPLQTTATPSPWTPVPESEQPPMVLDLEAALSHVRPFLDSPPSSTDILFILQPFRVDPSGEWTFSWCQPWSSLGETLEWQWTDGELFCTLMPHHISMSMTWTRDELGRVDKQGHPVLEDLVVSSSWPVSPTGVTRMCAIYRSVLSAPNTKKNKCAGKKGKSKGRKDNDDDDDEREIPQLGPLCLISYGT